MELKILIIDYTTHHPEVVQALHRIFTGHRIHLVLTSSFKAKFIEEFAPYADISLVKPKKLARDRWLAQLSPLFANQDIIIFSTALRDSLLLGTLGLKTRAKKIALIHNAHYFTESYPIDRKNYSQVFNRRLDSWRSWVDYLAQRWKFTKRKIGDIKNGTRFSAFAKRIDYFCFGGEHMAEHFSALTELKNVLVAPMYNKPYSESLIRPAYEGVLRIAILGLVSPERRDYLGVIAALGTAEFIQRVELHIIGRCLDSGYATQIAEEIRRGTNKNFNVIFSPQDQFVPVGEVLQSLKSVHLLLSPIQLDFAFHFYQEKYGVSKISGAEADCIRYNRPILMPSAYRCSKDIAPFVAGYRDPADLAKKVSELLQGDNLQRLYAQSQNFSIEDLNTAMVAKFIEQCTSS